jgi:hypothetical protein
MNRLCALPLVWGVALLAGRSKSREGLPMRKRERRSLARE